MAQGVRHALITGSSRGIGRGIALALAETGVNVAVVTESVDYAARYEERLARVQVGSLPADGKRGDADQPENGFVELVVAVRCGHARISRGIALEDADTASGLVRVDVKTDGKSPYLDRLGSGVSHGAMIPR